MMARHRTSPLDKQYNERSAMPAHSCWLRSPTCTRGALEPANDVERPGMLPPVSAK